MTEQITELTMAVAELDVGIEFGPILLQSCWSSSVLQFGVQLVHLSHVPDLGHN